MENSDVAVDSERFLPSIRHSQAVERVKGNDWFVFSSLQNDVTTKYVMEPGYGLTSRYKRRRFIRFQIWELDSCRTPILARTFQTKH
jgi:hypothetical protein